MTWSDYIKYKCAKRKRKYFKFDAILKDKANFFSPSKRIRQIMHDVFINYCLKTYSDECLKDTEVKYTDDEMDIAYPDLIC